ncbi:MAG: tRNA (adenosine(37)-N6)-threonylcarbamoyltransferase complex dimerization subunit type 1 TsaB [Planctomycetes bacterium]|nr:tRNA (adenosine(37)-N6)-threonylcarbamoyltransferase complex dimerization subunit type 1 TsaB [Planctomycetota bacterium]
MIVLGIETAGPHGSVALLEPDARGGARVVQTVLTATRQLGAELAPTIQRMLRAAGLGPRRPPDLVAVDTGPGSYTGLRIGLAAAKGLAFAWGRPLLGVPCVDALEALAPPGERVVCALDASRGQVYAATFLRTPEGVVREQAAGLHDPAILRQALARPAVVVGDAAAQVSDEAAGLVAAPDVRWPTAEQVAALAYARFARGERQDALRLCPIYFHLNEAEEQRRKRGMRVG